jgi:hypothetical protein
MYKCYGSGCAVGSESIGSICFWASRIRIRIHLSQVWIRILRIFPSSSKNNKKSFIYTVLWLLYDFLFLKNDVNLPVFLGLPDPHPAPLVRGIWIRGSWFASISVPKCHGSATLIKIYKKNWTLWFRLCKHAGCRSYGKMKRNRPRWMSSLIILTSTQKWVGNRKGGWGWT